MTDFGKSNPWAGLSSYQDGGRLKFCGRDNESYDVANLIDNHIFVTLYGKSGTGKTSLLNAGVFPLLRQKGYLPVSVRLGMDALDLGFQQCLVQKILLALEGRGKVQTVPVVSLPEDERDNEYLWRYFARTRFTDASGKVLFPVVVLDQFEEVFRTRRGDAEVLLRQIHFMMDESHALGDRTVDGQPYSYDFNFRFVVSIREDDLYRLEDSIDNNYLAEMKSCRYRLRNLTDEGARDVILLPGGDAFAPEEKDRIADRLVGMARSLDDGMVSAVVLSLVCSRVYDDCARSGAGHITLPQVEKFIKGNPFEKFYNEATEGLTRKEKAYIEKNLVDSAGRRNSIPESDFFRNVRNGSPLFEGAKRILQRSSTSSGSGQVRVELIHDSFCEPLARLKEKREKRERTRGLIYAMGIALLCLVVGFFLVWQNRTIRRQNKSMAEWMDTYEELADGIQHMNAELADSEPMRQNDLLHDRLLMATLGSTGMKADDIKDLGDGAFEVDGIIYPSPSLEGDELMEWKEANHDLCKKKIEGETDRYIIPETMLEEEPVLVYLLLQSPTITSKYDPQEWFDVYDWMDRDMCLRLYSTFYGEVYHRAHAELVRSATSKRIQEKYAGLLSSYQRFRDLTRQNPDNYAYFFTDFGLQDRLLSAYAALGDETYEELLSEALDDAESLDWKDPVSISRLVSLKNRMGALRFRGKEYAAAMTYFEEAFALDSVATVHYLAECCNAMAYESAKEGNFRQAVKTIDRAIALLPFDPNYYDTKGEILCMAGQWEDVVPLWNRVISIDPDYVVHHDGGTPFYRYLKERGLLNE